MELAVTAFTNTLIFILFMYIITLILGVFLQIFLSKKENKTLGKILPIISLTFAIFLSLITSINTNGAIFLIVFFIFNIPTIIYYGIYKKYNKQILTIENEVTKMNIQDLE